MLFNFKTVSDLRNMYANRSYLVALLNYNVDIRNYRLTSEGWHKDKHDPMNEAKLKHKQNLSEVENTALKVQILS